MVGALPRAGAQGRGARAGRGLWESAERKGRARLAVGVLCLRARGRPPQVPLRLHLGRRLALLKGPAFSSRTQLPLAAGRA